MERKILAVSQINAYIKQLLDSDGLLQELCVRGEISNYKVYPSGHHYFTLKDPAGALRCVMFRSSASALRFRPENGMQVLALGRITVEEGYKRFEEEGGLEMSQQIVESLNALNK